MSENGYSYGHEYRGDGNLGFLPFSLVVHAPALDVDKDAAGDYVKGLLFGAALYMFFGK